MKPNCCQCWLSEDLMVKLLGCDCGCHNGGKTPFHVKVCPALEETWLDRMAGRALQTLIQVDGFKYKDDLARTAYQIAEAMLREKQLVESCNARNAPLEEKLRIEGEDKE